MLSNLKTLSSAAAAIFLFPAAEVMAQEQVYSHVADEYAEVKQGDVMESASEKSFGTVDPTAVSHSALDFTPYDQSDGSVIEGNVGLRYCTSNCTLISTYELPTGVELTGITLDYTDPDASGGLTAFLSTCSENTLGCGILTSVISNDDGDSTVSGTVSQTVDSLNNSYIVELVIEGGTSDYAAGNVTLHYQRQVSPAPGTATFGDVPTGHPFFQHVEALVASGITAGCGGGDYCPDSPLTRGQMAVFLAAALGLHWPD